MKKKSEKYILSANLIREKASSEDGEIVLFNTVTGQRLTASRETLKLLQQFKKETTLIEVAGRLNLRGSLDQITSLAERLLRSSALIKVGDNEHGTLRQINETEWIIKPTVSFLNAEFEDYRKIKRALAFVGIPVDFATTGYAGAKLAPECLRSCSVKMSRVEQDIFTGKSKGFYSYNLRKTILKGLDIFDCGDIIHELSENPCESYKRMQATSAHLLKNSNLPVFIGGDHSISAPLIRSTASFLSGDLSVVQFDAHTDLADWSVGQNHHHGNMMARVLHENPKVKIWQYGLRGFAGSSNVLKRVVQVPQSAIGQSKRLIQLPIPKGKKCYLTIDIDVLDPVYAPGTGTPVPMGMSPSTLLSLIKRIVCQNEIVAIDLVEVNPARDSNDLTANTAVTILLDALGLIL